MNITPSKFYGQNFLINEGIVEKIIVAAELTADDVVLEVGPGKGALTEKLIARAGRVVAVEKDPKLFIFLQSKFKNAKNLELINADILNLQLATFNLRPYKIVANIPYNITGQLFQKFLLSNDRPQMIVIMLQKEVGDKLLGRGGKTLLSVVGELYGRVEKICDVAPGSFNPPPKIDSMVVRLLAGEKYEKEKQAMRLAKIGFLNKRKKLISNLSTGIKKSKEEIADIFIALNINLNARAEELSKDDWLKLAEKIG
jgi:16S rRNA (adenine1518-N6/adenine1519-N6)-dimethyltransferase